MLDLRNEPKDKMCCCYVADACVVFFQFCCLQWVLSSKEINFPYPLGLTLLHMVFSSVVCFILTKVLKVCVYVSV